MKVHRSVLFPGFYIMLAVLTGCGGREEIKVYRIAKAPVTEQPTLPAQQAPMSQGNLPPMAAGGMPPMAAATTGLPTVEAPQISDVAPAGWKAQPPSSMRQASYLVNGDGGATADVSLIVLEGAAGGNLDNINRWLSQLGQPPITEDKLAQLTQHVKSTLGDVVVVDLQGLPQGADPAKDGRIVAGIAFSGGKTFFFKMRGNAELAEKQKSNFIKWITSVKAAASAPAAASAEAAPAGKPKIKWTVPGNWKEAPPASMRFASFTAPGANGEVADVSVVVLPGTSGGDLDNVNRWRKQAGLDPVDEAGLKALVAPVKAKDGAVSSVDLAGPKQHIVAGWALVDGSTWFFKISGPDGVVAAEKGNFNKFLQSVQFHP